MTQVYGNDPDFAGVQGDSIRGPGVEGYSTSNAGVKGHNVGSKNSDTGYPGAGVEAISDAGPGVRASSNTGVGVEIWAGGTEAAIYAYSNSGYVLFGESTFGPGIEVTSEFGGPGISGSCWHGPGVQGEGWNGPGVFGIGYGESAGVEAVSEHGPAINATGNSDASTIHVTSGLGQPAILAEVPDQAWGLYAIASGSATGVFAESQDGTALYGRGDGGTGVHAESVGGVALEVVGRIQVRGSTEYPATQIVGVATLPTGDTSVVITTPAASADSLVLLTPYADPGGQLWVNVKKGAFAVHTSVAPTKDVRIGYLIIN